MSAVTVRGISLRPAAVLRRGGGGDSRPPLRPGTPAAAAVLPAPAARPRSLSAGYYRARQFALTHALVTDAVLALVLAGVCTPWLVTTRPSPLSWVLQAGLLIPLAWRRRYPAGVFIVVCAVALAQWLVGIRLVADLALLVALSTLATYRPRRVALAAAGVLEVGAVLASVAWRLAGSWLSSLVFLSGMVAAALLLGISVRARSALVATLTERAGRLERERDQQAQIAAAAERTRIAREMHDIVAHSLSVVISLADGAALSNGDGDDEATEAMQQVSTVGREALAEMRRLLGVLRDDTDAAELAPQPGLARLEDLLDQVRAVGLPVRVAISGEPRPISPIEDATAYRIVQESLTNTLKHADRPTEVSVTIVWTPDALSLEVRDDGVSGRRFVRAPGHGLLGMSERAALFDGSVSAGPIAGRGWRVNASLPLVSAS
jgi:signal transduction histidine kinase